MTNRKPFIFHIHPFNGHEKADRKSFFTNGRQVFMLYRKIVAGYEE
jgi:hypothetical protein